MDHPDLSCAFGNESWEPFVAQHQTPLTLDHSCRAADVIRQRGGGGGAGSQEGAGGRTQPRRDLIRFTLFGVEGGLFWCLLGARF